MFKFPSPGKKDQIFKVCFYFSYPFRSFSGTKRFTSTLVLPIGGYASNLSFMEQVKLKNVFREFVEKTETKVRLIGSALIGGEKGDAGLTLFTSFLQYFTPEFLEKYVRVTSIVTEEVLLKSGYQIKIGMTVFFDKNRLLIGLEH